MVWYVSLPDEKLSEDRVRPGSLETGMGILFSGSRAGEREELNRQDVAALGSHLSLTGWELCSVPSSTERSHLKTRAWALRPLMLVVGLGCPWRGVGVVHNLSGFLDEAAPLVGGYLYVLKHLGWGSLLVFPFILICFLGFYCSSWHSKSVQ